MKHAKLVNVLGLLWLWCFAGLTWAANTFAQDVRGYDWESLLWGAAAGLLGGALRTILTLATDSRVVLDILRESWKDAIVALIGGGVAYALVQAAASLHLFEVSRDLRMLIIVGFGWSRGRWMGKLDKITGDAINAARRKYLGATADAPSSAAMPLSDK